MKISHTLCMLAMTAAIVSYAHGPSELQAQTAANQTFIKQLHWARAGNVESQMFVAKAFREGVIVERNMQQAVAWYTQAAKRGNFEAQYQAARILHAGGDGVTRQPEAAVKLYRAAAKRGHPGAQNWLGYAYQHGHGVVKDYHVAAEWYQNAADQGHADAFNNLGLLHLVGKGVPQDHTKAAQYFQKAVDQGHGFAMNNLAGMYEVGWGVQRDQEKAKELYLSGSLTGNASAIENLKRLGAEVPAEAERKLWEKKHGRTKASLALENETTTDGEVLNRGDIISEVPGLEASDEEFEAWLNDQESDEAADNPDAPTASSDPFDLLQKNWNSVNRQRFRRRRASPSDSLR